ncbi:FxsB family cyclophane-forming radical SAM/SPASM peptide maturase [Sphaerisporangium sp. NPDC049002]|uniref:FxsB family cyclophane-forming radical SAM/SPASM peptide maturase n=1 Tax=Sphaerisporangium sp. NPDC049002 TaxID=3155392 RepID=UPI0033D463BC
MLKVSSRCDLACDHCYVYEHADQSWRRRPKIISRETLAAATARIAEHARAHALPAVHVVLHGGEPLLAGHAFLEEAIIGIRRAMRGICEVDLRVHTNGVTLDEEFCEIFAANDVRVGVSLDGDRPANDLHRRYADGRGSYDRVVRAVNLLRGKYRGIYAGLLCTIDVRNDPVAVYEALVALQPPMVDFLLPQATWDHPPMRPDGDATSYADWLIGIFDRWVKDGQPVRMRIFESIVRTSQGGNSLTEALGVDECDLVVIETDGEYEQADSLKTAFDGAPSTGRDVFGHSLDEAARSPRMSGHLGGLEGLCDTCRACPVVESCGGGLYAHRYRTGSGFLNPSVYCADLMKLITHVRSRTRVRDEAGGAPATHAIPLADLDALASGYGGGDALAVLAESQKSLRRALVASVNEMAGPAVSEAWKLLTVLDREHPGTVQEVLDHPYVRVWSVGCLEQGRRATAETGYLANIAAAAAVRAGVTTRLTVSVPGDALYLPTLGSVATGQVGEAIVETRSGAFTVTSGDRHWDIRPGEPVATYGWHPHRLLTAGGMAVVLDDVDPFRDCYDLRVSSRLSAGRLAGWREMFAGAWELIQRDHPAYLPALTAGLRVLTPLEASRDGSQVSATARQAFGAIGVALPAGPEQLALLMIHEFQHVKLGAIFDLLDLYDENDVTLYRAAWRKDPRPLDGLLQGAYAHMAVTDFWRVRRHALTGASAESATARFLHWREATADAIQTLATSGSLTALGERFVGGMRATVQLWAGD